jgi:hypothetical protein
MGLDKLERERGRKREKERGEKGGSGAAVVPGLQSMAEAYFEP